MPADAVPWDEAAAVDALARLWSAYADGLDQLADVLPPATATRFRIAVLERFRSPDPPTRMQATAAWPGWRPDALPIAGRPNARVQAALCPEAVGSVKLHVGRRPTRFLGAVRDVYCNQGGRAAGRRAQARH